ncbi:MAG: hypothetical protein GTO22_21030 [Gemmatimonadales bacterium]|nr:hypothetical protein [Gemmatimonadales bacterium]
MSDKATSANDQNLHTDNADDVGAAERDYLGVQPTYGLAISGGGIRSASFGMGVLQGLVRGGLLEKVDYLSTVSGGGYIGSSLTWFLKKGLPDGTPAGTDESNFPFGARGVGGRLEGKRNAILDFIRQHGNYLTPGKGLTFISLVAAALRSIIIALFVYLALATVFMVVLDRLATQVARWINGLGWFDVAVPESLGLFLPFALVGVAIFGLSALFYSLRTRLARQSGKIRYRWSVMGQQYIGWTLTLVIVFVVIGSIPYAGNALGDVWRQTIAGGFATVVGAISGFWQFWKAQSPKRSAGEELGAVSKLGTGFRTIVGTAALIYGILLSAYILSAFILSDSVRTLWWFGGLVAVTALVGIVVNLNYVGLHRMYRDRLMETFMPNLENVKNNRWGPATEADEELIEEMCGPGRERPYHLVNTNVVLAQSSESKYRGRGGDNFILSPLFCGSDATGWRRTSAYMKQMRFRGRSRGMTLSTAMAISGAALNPHAGVAGGGVTRNRLVSALLSLLNLRLGYWAPNPKVDSFYGFTPNFLAPGFSCGVLGLFLSEKSRSVELTDGGHFENLALYELIRRRLKVIIVSDGSADPGFRFGDLANAIERVRVDFGTKISFREDAKVSLDGLLPGSAEPFPDEKYKLAARGHAIADIEYDADTSGILIYLKTTLTRGLPRDVYGYKDKYPSFPDQTTGDQFFDEVQFEAYRELGYQLTKTMLKEPEIQPLLSGKV